MKKIFLSLIIFLGLVSIFSTTYADTTPDPVSINLKIYAGDTVLFDGPETVIACAESLADNAPLTVNGKCAIEQSGLSNTWTWNYAPSGWLDELGGYTTTSDFSKFWSWFHDLNLGGTGLNQHSLSAGEELLLTYGSYPLRISASKTSGTVGDTINFTAEEESTFDTNYNMIWTPSSEVTITLGTQTCITITDGTCSIVSNTVGSLNAIGNKTLYVPSANLNIEISAAATGSGGGAVIPPASFSTTSALAYLKNIQATDGSFGGADLYTDWVGLAFGAMNVTDSSRDTLLSYFNSHNTISSLLTDNERHTMALLSLGKNPYSFNGVNYIDAITGSFDGTQFGDIDLVNDDIFALIPLSSAGYTANDDIITKDIAFIISKQKTDGGWEESVDITAAAIQALKPFASVAGVSDALSKAANYIANAQDNDGGWGYSGTSSVSSTSWVMQAMSALNASWIKNNKSGMDYLATQQALATDGAVLPSSETLQNRIWATSYAIAGGSLKPWSAIMQSVSKPVAQPILQSGSGGKLNDTVQNIPTPPPDVKTPDPVSVKIIQPKPKITIENTKNIITNKKKDVTTLKNKSGMALSKLLIHTNLSKTIPETLTATAVNALPVNNIPKNLPIVLGSLSGIILLFSLALKFLVI